MPIRANALVVMVKAPIPGRVKTRLMPFLSAAQAAALASALLLDQLEHLRGRIADQRVAAYLDHGLRCTPARAGIHHCSEHGQSENQREDR